MTHPTHSKTVAESYQALVDSGVIEADAAQRALVARLDAILDEERKRHLSRKSSSLGWLFGRKRGTEPVRGLYIHGAVGRGKSMLMDLFFALVPWERKRRVHFNAFMADAHERIHRQRRAFAEGRSRETDPIPPVGRDLARRARLLCFDEFAVNDIADAMVLGRLFSVLFEERVTVIATSNVAPDELYRDGLNRQLFLPFVDMLKRRLDLFELDARTDYRLEKMAGGRAYLSPLNDRHARAMEALWRNLTDGHEVTATAIELKGRQLPVRRAAGAAAWFTFAELCEEARSAEDYLAIAARFDRVFIEGVPMMDLSMRNAAKRFILLIDTLYDSGTRTVISAAANPHALYQAGSGVEVFEFQRTASRLIEMQSPDYERRPGSRWAASASR
ncbi:MAG: cell division protein ZapE [Alphaproteobacteria bacterium]|nr:MAG: cell division protein ZapE [Alphaproteobacteria bacterium]